MGIVTGYAGNARVATFFPAAAFFQAVRLKAQAQAHVPFDGRHLHRYIGPSTIGQFHKSR